MQQVAKLVEERQCYGYYFLLVINSNYGPISHTESKLNGDFGGNWHIFPVH